MAQDGKGKRFENEVLKTLQDMGVESYGSHDQIPLQELYPEVGPGHNFEIDIVSLVSGICILIETTTQEKRNHQKIERFIQKCERIRECKLDKRDLFSCFSGIPKEKLPRFTGISDWRYLYIGTSNELSNPEFSSSNYPDTIGRLEIFHEANWEYFKTLTRSIKHTSRYEFFAALKIDPTDLNDPVLGDYLPPRRCLELTNTTLGSGQVQASLAVAIFTPDELLRITRVSRYQGQPLTVSTGSSMSTEDDSKKKKSGYQRLLSQEKLGKIADFVNNNPDVTFPTNLTLVLSNECKVDAERLYIPAKYASIDMIDGQHRLFSYTLSDNEQVRSNAQLIATCIKFHTEKSEEINQYAAQTFITINREQTKVKRELILLISYDVLAEKTPEAIAAKTLKMCDDKPNGVLERVFAIRAFIKKSQFNQRPIPIISVVEELARISKLENLSMIRNVLGECTEDAEGIQEDYEMLIQAMVTLLENYFSLIKKVFSVDWGNSRSLLMCAKYFAAFIKLLGTFTVTDNQFTIDQIEAELLKIKQNILDKYNKGRDNHPNLVFNPDAYHAVKSNLPNKSKSITKIYELLDENR